MAIQRELHDLHQRHDGRDHSQSNAKRRLEDSEQDATEPLVDRAHQLGHTGIGGSEPVAPHMLASHGDARRVALQRAAQLGVLGCVGIYALGQVVYLTPFIQETFSAAVSPWLGVAVSRSPTGVIDFDGGHVEMIRPMFFVIWSVLPLLASLVLFELSRDRASPRRAASRVVMRTGAFLRRKPCVFGHVSPLSTGELLFQLALVGGNAVLFGYGWVYTRQFLPVAGDAYTFNTVLEISGIVLGYNCVFNMAFLFVPSTRNCAWMDFAGISYANGVKYHRWLGVATLVTGVAHAAPFYWLWTRQGALWVNAVPCFDCAIDYSSPGYKTWFNVFGELSLLALLVVGVTSIPFVRRALFETFYYTHHLYILGVVFAVMHWVTIIWWLLPTLVLYLISRSVSTWNALHPVHVLALTALPDGIVKIVLARTTDADGAFEIGQFVYLCVPAVSVLQWHAFTIASAPTTSPRTFTILLKSLGDWTRDLVALANATAAADSSRRSGSDKRAVSVMPTMLVDGFYGASLQCYDAFSTLCLIGGGIGATPLFAILEDIAARLRASHDATRPLLHQRVHFVFSFRELCLLEEVHPVLAALRELDPHGRRISFYFFLTRRPSDAVLAQPIDYARLSASHTLSPQSTASQPFAEPLRSRASRILVYVVMLASSTLLVLWLEYGGGRLMQSGTQWWPLEQFVEVTTLFVLPLIVFLVLALERVTKRHRRAATRTSASLLSGRGDCSGSNIQSYSSISATAAAGITSQLDVVTLGDLVTEYNVTVGARPDMDALLAPIHSEFVASSRDSRDADALCIEHERIGVFISGPEALKTATEHAVASLGSRAFDIHEEEFEL